MSITTVETTRSFDPHHTPVDRAHLTPKATLSAMASVIDRWVVGDGPVVLSESLGYDVVMFTTSATVTLVDSEGHDIITGQLVAEVNGNVVLENPS